MAIFSDHFGENMYITYINPERPNGNINKPVNPFLIATIDIMMVSHVSQIIISELIINYFLIYLSIIP